MKNPIINKFLGHGVFYHPSGSCVMTKGDNRMVLDVRGWGEIQYMFESIEESQAFQDQLGEYIADAINKKLSKKLSTTKNK
tara:strand:- start:11 stop:253 length:243 start_codon:yes stop_codon:yes gene_type:complete